MASESALPSPPPFLAATLVLRSRAIFASLVQDSVTAFLDSAVEMEFWQACKLNSAALLEHIWQGCSPETEPSPASLGPGSGGRWSRRKYLRTDRHYRRFQFRRGIVEAVKQDKALELVQWLYAHFHGCIVPFGAVQEAARAGKLELLEFFKDHEIPAKIEGGRAARDEIEAEEGNVVRWGRHDMARAAERKDNMHVVQWLHDNTPRDPRCIREALFSAVRNGDVKMLRWFCAQYKTGREAAREFGTLADGEDGLDDMMRREEEEIERIAMGLFIPIRMNAEGATTGTGAAIPAVVAMVGAFNLALRVGRQARVNPPAAAVAAVAPAQQGAQPEGAGGLFPPNLEQLLQEAVAARVAAGTRGLEPEAPVENIMELMQEDREGLMVGENAKELLRGSPQDFMRESVLGRHLNVMRWLLKNGYARNAFLAVWVAINARRLDMVMWLIRNKLLEAGRALEAAARLGCLDIAKRLYSRYWKHIREQRYYPLTESPVRGMLRTQRDPPMWISEKTMAGAVALGDLDLVEWLVETFGAEIDLFGAAVAPGWTPFQRPHLIDTAARHLPVVKYLHQISVRMTARGSYTDASGRAVLGTGPTASVNAMDSAAAYNCLDVVQWLHAHRPEGCTARAMDSAAAQGHLEVVQWLHENRREGCSILAMDDAASAGHLEVVKWLHANRSEGCTTRAMDSAAAQGHLDVVKWLHLNRSEGCTTAAMDAAAALGHLDIVKWLHDHHVGGCTIHAMDNAAASGNLEVVKWLHEHRSEGCTARAMEEAVAAGHLDVVQWLQEHRIEGCTKIAMDLAARFWDFDLVLFLHSQRREGCTAEAFRAARKRDVFMDMYEPDADFPSDNIFDWLSEQYPGVKPRRP